MYYIRIVVSTTLFGSYRHIVYLSELFATEVTSIILFEHRSFENDMEAAWYAISWPAMLDHACVLYSTVQRHSTHPRLRKPHNFGQNPTYAYCLENANEWLLHSLQPITYDIIVWVKGCSSNGRYLFIHSFPDYVVLK